MGLVPVRIVDSETGDDDTLAFAAPPLIRSGPVADADLAVALSVLGIGVVGLYLRSSDNNSADAAVEVRGFFNDRGGRRTLDRWASRRDGDGERGRVNR